MPKLDVGVGDEFPTEEIHRDENGVVHHHHYYRRRGPRRPFGLFRFILGVVLIVLVVRLFHYADWMMDMDMDVPWMPPGVFPFAGTMVAICVVAGLIYLLRCRDWDRPW